MHSNTLTDRRFVKSWNRSTLC